MLLIKEKQPVQPIANRSGELGDKIIYIKLEGFVSCLICFAAMSVIVYLGLGEILPPTDFFSRKHIIVWVQ